MFSVYTANQGPVINCPWNENDPMTEHLLQLSAVMTGTSWYNPLPKITLKGTAPLIYAHVYNFVEKYPYLVAHDYALLCVDWPVTEPFSLSL